MLLSNIKIELTLKKLILSESNLINNDSGEFKMPPSVG